MSKDEVITLTRKDMDELLSAIFQLTAAGFKASTIIFKTQNAIGSASGIHVSDKKEAQDLLSALQAALDTATILAKKHKVMPDGNDN